MRPGKKRLHSSAKAFREIELESKNGLSEVEYAQLEDIVVYGHLLNEQDYSYFGSLFKLTCYGSKPNHPTLTFAYSVLGAARKKEEMTNRHELVYNLLAHCAKANGLKVGHLERMYYVGKLRFKEID